MIFGEAFTRINGREAIRAASEMLQKIDKRLIEHGERTAFIACELMEEAKLPLDEETLYLLCVFHDIGAYKTDEIDRMVEFETKNVQNHAIYGYLFLKYLSPLSGTAEAILYHHTPWERLQKIDCACGEYASLIHLADRIDIVCQYGDVERSIENNMHHFSRQYTEVFRECCRRRRILERLADGSYKQDNEVRFQRFYITKEEVLAYLKMIVYAIDFRSEHTVTHSINTISIALNIAKHFGLDKEEQEKIYLGALLHDAGKIAIPPEILEYPGKLTEEQMKIMRTHVDETEKLIRGTVPDEICQIAIRHHEKLDGTGYPHGRSAGELTFSQRIVAVADIASALSSRRSYKEPFPKELTVRILREMQGVKLDADICEYLCTEYDNIMAETEEGRRAVIQKYQSMLEEGKEIAKRFASES